MHPFFDHYAQSLIAALRAAAESNNQTIIQSLMQCVHEGIADHNHVAQLLRELSEAIAATHPNHAEVLLEFSQMPGDQIRAIFGTLGDVLHPPAN